MVLSGMLKPKSGRIVFEDREFSALTLRTALKLGIEMVYQEVCLNEHFTVAENLFFASAGMNTLRWNKKKHLFEATQKLFISYGFDIDPGLLVKNLNLSAVRWWIFSNTFPHIPNS
jgi:ABC-type sugar transport system ATPase subunit